MKRNLALIFLIFLCIKTYSNDSLLIEERFNSLNRHFELETKTLENQITEIRRDQLNYQIEKDLIRETYKANFDRINLAITFILGIFGILGFLGIRDINSIKKQFSSELDNLSNLRNTFQTKISELDAAKEKYDKVLADITQTNIDQNKKLQVIEIKEKINKCLRENEFTRAFEYCIVALELAPNDSFLLRTKAVIYNRLGKFDEQKKTLLLLKEMKLDDSSNNLDLIEAHIFNCEVETAKNLIKEHEQEIQKKSDGKLYTFLHVLISYIEEDKEKLKAKILKEIEKYDIESKSSKINGWSVTEALYFVVYSKIDNKQDIVKNYLWFMEGQITGKEAIERINKIE